MSVKSLSLIACALSLWSICRSVSKGEVHRVGMDIAMGTLLVSLLLMGIFNQI